MGLLSNIKTMVNIQRINNGGVAKLSISQVANAIINLPDARDKLSSEEFSRIYALFMEMRKCKTKLPMDMGMYFDTAVRIIKEFDKIAPYEKYSGGNELEFSFMMEDIWGRNHEEIRRLRRLNYELEVMIAQWEEDYEKNKAILAEALTDEELNRRVSNGLFPPDRVSGYVNSRNLLKDDVEKTPQRIKKFMQIIEENNNQIRELEE